jgi:hypothetical protein
MHLLVCDLGPGCCFALVRKPIDLGSKRDQRAKTGEHQSLDQLEGPCSHGGGDPSIVRFQRAQ